MPSTFHNGEQTESKAESPQGVCSVTCGMSRDSTHGGILMGLPGKACFVVVVCLFFFHQPSKPSTQTRQLKTVGQDSAAEARPMHFHTALLFLGQLAPDSQHWFAQCPQCARYYGNSQVGKNTLG